MLDQDTEKARQMRALAEALMHTALSSSLDKDPELLAKTFCVVIGSMFRAWIETDPSIDLDKMCDEVRDLIKDIVTGTFDR